MSKIEEIENLIKEDYENKRNSTEHIEWVRNVLEMTIN